jgi:hypothetical protein
VLGGDCARLGPVRRLRGDQDPDPDLDPTGRLAHDLTGTVVAAFEAAGTR